MMHSPLRHTLALWPWLLPLFLLSLGCQDKDVTALSEEEEKESKQDDQSVDDNSTQNENEGEHSAESDSDTDTDGDSDSDSDTDTSEEASDPCEDYSGENVIYVTEENNYWVATDLIIEELVVKDATDFVIDWSHITKDHFGKPFDAEQDVQTVLVSLWQATPDELTRRINRDDLPLDLNVAGMYVYPEGEYTQQHVFNFGVMVGKVPDDDLELFFNTSREDYSYDQKTHTFMVSLGATKSVDRDFRMLAYFTLDPESENEEIVLHDKSTKMEFQVGLTQVERVPVPIGTNKLELNWEAMVGQPNGPGNEWIRAQITEVYVARFGSYSLQDLEDNFLDLIELESVADEVYKFEVLSGDQLELSGDVLEDSPDGDFQGIDDNGIWIIATYCTATCKLPAPWSITVLKACF